MLVENIGILFTLVLVLLKSYYIEYTLCGTEYSTENYVYSTKIQLHSKLNLVRQFRNLSVAKLCHFATQKQVNTVC